MPLVGIGTPPSRRLVCPLPPVSGGRGTLTGEKGVGRVPIPTRGIHCGTLYMYVLCDLDVNLTEKEKATVEHLATAGAKVIIAGSDCKYITTAATATAVSLEFCSAQATATASTVGAEKRNKQLLQRLHQE